MDNDRFNKLTREKASVETDALFKAAKVIGKAFNPPKIETPKKEKSRTNDPVNPNHYKDLGEYSPIHVIEKWGLDYHLGQVLKYIGRAGKKPDTPKIQDLRKAAWYLNRAIERCTD